MQCYIALSILTYTQKFMLHCSYIRSESRDTYNGMIIVLIFILYEVLIFMHFISSLYLLQQAINIFSVMNMVIHILYRIFEFTPVPQQCCDLTLFYGTIYHLLQRTFVSVLIKVT
jgi:hypothetical protein